MDELEVPKPNLPRSVRTIHALITGQHQSKSLRPSTHRLSIPLPRVGDRPHKDQFSTPHSYHRLFSFDPTSHSSITGLKVNPLPATMACSRQICSSLFRPQDKGISVESTTPCLIIGCSAQLWCCSAHLCTLVLWLGGRSPAGHDEVKRPAGSLRISCLDRW